MHSWRIVGECEKIKNRGVGLEEGNTVVHGLQKCGGGGGGGPGLPHAQI